MTDINNDKSHHKALILEAIPQNIELKDSGNKFIGSIPIHWCVKRIRFTANIVRGGSPRPIDQFITDNEEGYNWIKISDATLGDKYIHSTKQKIIPEGLSRTRFVRKNTLLLTNSMSFGYPYILDIDGCIHDGWLAFSNYNGVEKEFVYYFLMSDVCMKQFVVTADGSVVQNLNIDKVKNSFIALPPSIEEQTVIVEYLDDKCTKIDEAITKHRTLIEKLKEYKKAVITKAVTKGLDPNAEMKDSGNKYIGLIPSQWGFCKILFVLSMPITDGPHETPKSVDQGIPFVSAEAVSAGNGTIDFDHIWGYVSQEFYEECCKKYVPQIDDIYMIKSGATTGKVAIVNTNRVFTIWSPLAVFRTNKNIMAAKFLFYYLQSDGYLRQVELRWNYGTQQNIGMRTIEKLKVCVPSLIEQYKIITFLDEKCAKIDEAIARHEGLITKLEEYKKSIIYNAVTGKIDCRKDAE